MRILIATIISFIALTSISFADGTYYNTYLSESDCRNSCPTTTIDHAHCDYDAGPTAVWYCYRQSSGGNTCPSGQKYTILQPTSSITLSNGCLLTISSLGTLNCGGTYTKSGGSGYSKILYGTKNQPNYITTGYESGFICGVGPLDICQVNPDNRFHSEWSNNNLNPSLFSIDSKVLYKYNGYPPRNPSGDGYGYELTAGGHCTVLSVGACATDGSSCPLPTPAFPAQKITVQAPDATSSYFHFNFKVGECNTNDIGDGTSTECRNIYGSVYPICDTSTNICKPLHHCSSSDPAIMCQISCGQVGELTTVDNSAAGYWKLTLTSQKSSVSISDHPTVNLNSRLLVGTTVGGSDKCLPQNSGAAGVPEQCSISNLAAGTYYIKTENVGGTAGNDNPSVTCTLGTPTLTSPSYGTVVDTNPKIEWSSVEGATTYHWEVREDISVTPSDSGCYYGTYAFPSNVQLNKNYFWTAKACSDNTCTNCGSLASESKFVVGECDRNDLTYGDDNAKNDRSSACLTKYSDGSKPRCKSSDLYPNPTWTCIPPEPCGPNADCPTNQCCTADSTLGSNADLPGTGVCKSVGTIRQPYLCSS